MINLHCTCVYTFNTSECGFQVASKILQTAWCRADHQVANLHVARASTRAPAIKISHGVTETSDPDFCSQALSHLHTSISVNNKCVRELGSCIRIHAVISYHIISYHIISYHIISYHIISYYIYYIKRLCVIITLFKCFYVYITSSKQWFNMVIFIIYYGDIFEPKCFFLAFGLYMHYHILGKTSMLTKMMNSILL